MVFLVNAQCGPVCFDEVEEFVPGTVPDENESSESSNDREETNVECISHYDCDKGLHNKCNEDGTEENYFCVDNKCKKTIQKIQWCNIKLCNVDEDCLLIPSIIPETFKEFDSFDCCNTTIDAFHKGTKGFWDSKFKYYFRDECSKKRLKCENEPIDLLDYMAVCRDNTCQAVKKSTGEKEEKQYLEQDIERVEIDEKKEEIKLEEKTENNNSEIETEGESEEKDKIVIKEDKNEEYVPFTNIIFLWILSLFRK